MPNVFVPIPPNTDQAQTINLVNKNFAVLDHETSTKLYKDVNGVPTILIGILPDGTTGIVIAKDGVDVTTLFS